MNRKVLIVLAVVFVVLAGIASIRFFKNFHNGSKKKEFRVLCITYPVALFARTLTEGTNTPVILVLPPSTGCPHDYALTPGDLMKISDDGRYCLIKNGAGLDDELCETLCRTAKPDVIRHIVDCSKGCSLIPSAEEEEEHDHEAEAGEHSEEEHHHHHSSGFNPHIFASPDTAKFMVGNILAGLIECDPGNAERYQENAKKLMNKLSKLEDDYKNAGLKGKKIAVQHGVFAYIARLTGMEEAVSLHADENQVPSPAVIAEIRRKIKKEKIPAFFAEPQYPVQAAQTIAGESGIRLAVLDPCASGPEDANAFHYIAVMGQNLNTLKETLK